MTAYVMWVVAAVAIVLVVTVAVVVVVDVVVVVKASLRIATQNDCLCDVSSSGGVTAAVAV